MALDPKALEVRLEDSAYGLSVRRLWEHTELGQVNVFGHAVDSQEGQDDPGAFIDVVDMCADGFSLVGCTLSKWRAGAHGTDHGAAFSPLMPDIDQSIAAKAFVQAVSDHLSVCAIRLATRNQHVEFLPKPQADDLFDQSFIHSVLVRRLLSLGKARASGLQWVKTVENFQKKGLRSDELKRSGLVDALLAQDDKSGQIATDDVVPMCNFSPMRLSVIPVISDAKRQLRFVSAPVRALKRAKKVPKAQVGQTRSVVKIDPVLGYRLEQIEHPALWGTDNHWQAVAHDGRVVNNISNQNLLATAESAAALAASDASLRFPKRLALGRWAHLAWTGGKDYREWLLTLPYYPASFFSSHFNMRNVLAHIRCDVRDGADGERVLLIQEIQSDWAKSLRDAIGLLEADEGHEQFPPFWREWSALAMKLVLLHAAHQGLDAVSWMRGEHQVLRYKGLGAVGLKRLYDEILPREVNRMMKSFGCHCADLEVFVPANFSIRQSEYGYDVYTAENELLGTALTLEDARQYVPDGAHELLYEVHGVRLSADIKQALLSTGFPAWG